MNRNRFAVGQPGQQPRQLVEGSDRFVRDQMLPGEVAIRLTEFGTPGGPLPVTSDL